MAELKSKSAGTGLAFKLFLALALCGAAVTLVVVLGDASSAGRTAISAFIASTRQDAAVSAAVAGTEAEALSAALRSSRSFSISNFQSQSNTSCFWLTLTGSGPSVEVRFLLAEHGARTEVVAVSLTRECDCPLDSDLPCALQ